MDKRILESVKEFYRNVKNEPFTSDIGVYTSRRFDHYDGSLNPNNISNEFYL